MAETKIQILSDPEAPIPQLADGVWLNLPEEHYFGQEGRLGSTDLSKLYLRKEGWWWSSWLNPHASRERKPATAFGKGLHKAVLEGSTAFKAATFIMPDKDTLRAQYGERFCVTAKEIVAQLEKRGMHPKQNESKAFFAQYCRQRAPDLVLWDVVAAEAEEKGAGKILLTEAERRDIELMASIIHNHAEIGTFFDFTEDHRPMPEVTVLYTDEHGIKRRCRLDEMFPQDTVDLKTIGGHGHRPLNFAVGDHVAEYAYHVQMADHHIARAWIYRMIQEGRVYDGHPVDLRTKESDAHFREQVAWLQRFPAGAPNWDYLWIFYQRPDAKAGNAPVVFPWAEERGGDLHRRGIRCRREALNIYRRCMEQFGADEPWTRVEPLHTSGELPAIPNRVQLPHWLGGDDPVAGEEDDV